MRAFLLLTLVLVLGAIAASNIPTGGGSGSSSSLTTSDTIWVDGDAGSDVTGARENQARPFQTITAAKNAAQAGDTIMVLPGTYNEFSLAKDQITYQVYPGASITNYSGSANGGYGIFDDRTNGPVVCNIFGQGDYVIGADAFATNIAGLCVVTNRLSRINFHFNSIKGSGYGISANFGFAGLHLTGGTNSFAGDRIWKQDSSHVGTASRARSGGESTIVTSGNHGLTSGNTVTITGLGGSGYNDVDPVVTVVNATTFTYDNAGGDEVTTADTGGTVTLTHAADGFNALYWEAGEIYCNVRHVNVDGYAYWGSALASIGATNNCYITGHRWESPFSSFYHASLGPASVSTGFKCWADVLEIFGPVSCYGGKQYINAEKISAAGPAIDCSGSTGFPEQWITAQKIESSSSQFCIGGSLGNQWITCQNIIYSGTGQAINFTGGTNTVIGQYLQVTGDGRGIYHGGGTTRIEGIEVDSRAASGTTNYPIQVEASGLTLKGVSTRSPAANVASIAGYSAQTVTIESGITLDRNPHANIAFTGLSTNHLGRASANTLVLPSLSTNTFLWLAPGGIVKTGVFGSGMTFNPATGTLTVP